MRFMSKKKKLYKLFLVLISTCLVFAWHFDELFAYACVNFYYNFFNDSYSIFNQPDRRFDFLEQNKNEIVFKSKCQCRENDVVTLKKDLASEVYVVNVTRVAQFVYSLKFDEFESSIFTCSLYNSLRRGPRSKVISFSLYGKDRIYYHLLQDLVVRAKKFYPSWIIRINHDNSIDKSVICELECLRAEDQSPYDNIDFCNIEELPYDLSRTWNASFMHAMSWRWLPLGDCFVDYFNSRDADSLITQRELDSFNVFFNSQKLFHIMRDHPQHNVPILGGMWGFASKLNRNLASHLFKLITNPHLASYYNPASKNKKGYDQFLLENFFYKYAKGNSIVHDSYSCQQFVDSEPFPTQRTNYFCHVGCQVSYETNTTLAKSKTNHKCPRECRPKEHQNWTYC